MRELRQMPNSPPPLRALLQTQNLVQPATHWTTDKRHNTASFTPLDVNHKPIRLQAMPLAIYYSPPDSHADTIKYLIRPPRLKSHLIKRDTFYVFFGARLSWYTPLSNCLCPPCPATNHSLHRDTFYTHSSDDFTLMFPSSPLLTS
jgi:hypothetical protein